MKHVYYVSGMSCMGCAGTVENAILAVEGVTSVEVNLEEGTVEVGSDVQIPFLKIQESMMINAPHYEISLEPLSGEQAEDFVEITDGAVYYCPMRCEGDKVYESAGDCPVCGMHLVPETIDETVGDKTVRDLGIKLVWSVIFCLPLFVISMGTMIKGNPFVKWLDLQTWNYVQFFLTIPIVFFTCRMFFIRAVKSFKGWNLNMFTLIGIGAAVAWIFSVVALFVPEVFPPEFKGMDGHVHLYFEATGVILTLVLLGQYLEARSYRKTNTAVLELIKMAPENASRLTPTGEETVPAEKIQEGDRLRIRPGEKIPVDGKILEGNSNINESMITGEPVPVYKEAKDLVKAGTLNVDGTFVIVATEVGKDTVLAHIIRMVKEASKSRAPIQKIADRIAKWFVPIVLAIALGTFLVWSLIDYEYGMVFALINAVAVLIIACPCALGLATPLSVMVGMGKGASEGVLIKDAESLENLGDVDILIIDKTGTLTEGKPTVEKVISTTEHYSESELMDMIYSINRFSEHPLATAIQKMGQYSSCNELEVNNFTNHPGMGVSGKIGDQAIYVGNHKMMIEANAAILNHLEDEVLQVQKEGKTVPMIAVDGEIVGYIVLSDQIKKGTKEAVDYLKSRGIELTIMSGDNSANVEAVARELGIKEHHGDCSPEDKLKEIKELQKVGRVVAMAGDGINDAPALALADVGIAMGTGTDVAIESASVTVLSGDLKGVAKSFELGRKTMKNIKQNLMFALAYNVIGIPIAAGILFPFTGMVLSPMIAALAMSFSSVSVIANSLRLKSARL